MTNTYGNNNGNGAVENSNDNSGANGVQLMGCRIAGPGDYMPAYTRNNDGKLVQSKCKFAVYQNVRGKKLKFEITAWGKLADAIAKYGATGKKVTIFGEMNPYKGRVWMQTAPGQQRQCYTDAAGNPIYVDKMGITIKSMNLGSDSAKTISEEIANGMRPQGWNDASTPGKQQWLQICAQRKAMQFNPGDTHFGYARVTLPNNGTVVAGNAANNAQQGGYGQTGQAQPQQNWQNNVQQQQVANPANNGGYAPNQPVQPQQNNGGQPVYVNGQNMGNQMPQNQAPANGGYAPNQGQYQTNTQTTYM